MRVVYKILNYISLKYYISIWTYHLYCYFLSLDTGCLIIKVYHGKWWMINSDAWSWLIYKKVSILQEIFECCFCLVGFQTFLSSTRLQKKKGSTAQKQLADFVNHINTGAIYIYSVFISKYPSFLITVNLIWLLLLILSETYRFWYRRRGSKMIPIEFRSQPLPTTNFQIASPSGNLFQKAYNFLVKYIKKNVILITYPEDCV